MIRRLREGWGGLKAWLAGSILVGPALLLAGCATLKPIVPPPPAEAVPVLIPIPQACKVQKVPESALASAGGLTGDIFEDVKRVLADRAQLLADRERLQAANSDPCPEHAK